MHPHTSFLNSYTTDLLSKGQVFFSREKAQNELGVSRKSFLKSAERMQKKKSIISPRSGFYIIVPPQYLNWGAPPPNWYIDHLMNFENSLYYVGLLKAAEIHGATHQAVMEFQVVTNKRIPSLQVGRTSLGFFYRKDLKTIVNTVGAIEEKKTDTGAMKLASVELTTLDLIRYSHACGGMNNIATCLQDLVEKIDPNKLARIAPLFERSIIQRLGYLLETLAPNSNLVSPLYEELKSRSKALWVEMEPKLSADRDFAPEIIEKNQTWKVRVRKLLEPDE